VASAGVGPIYDDRFRSVTHDIHWVKVAVAEAIAVRHIRDSTEQVLLAPLVEKRGCRNVGRKLDVEISELDRLVSVNAYVQLYHAIKISGNLVPVVQHFLGERLLLHPIKHQSPATSDVMHTPNSGDGKPQRLHGCVNCRLAECCWLRRR
jgi:hypothetical protein